MDIIIILALIGASGMFSGLTIGLMGLSVDEVQRAADLGDRDAAKVLPIVRQGNLLLVTLLLGNTAVNATLSIFLGAVVGGGILAGFIATALILIFGEILPAAVLTRHALRVGGRVSGLVKVVIALFYPIAWPIAAVLDRLLGETLPDIMSRIELRHIIETHHRAPESDIDSFDRDIMVGALSLQEQPVEAIMTPCEEVFAIGAKEPLDPAKIAELKQSGYTRFPVLWDDRVVGVLNIKKLVGSCSDDSSVEAYSKGSKIIHVPADSKVDDILYRMIKGKVHMASVADATGWVGIVTMEDILETLVGQEITDEYGH